MYSYMYLPFLGRRRFSSSSCSVRCAKRQYAAQLAYYAIIYPVISDSVTTWHFAEPFPFFWLILLTLPKLKYACCDLMRYWLKLVHVLTQSLILFASSITTYQLCPNYFSVLLQMNSTGKTYLLTYTNVP